MTQFTCKGVKQINNRISFKHFYHSYLSAFFISAGVPNGEFPEILAKKQQIPISYLLTLLLCTGVSCVRALSPAWTGSPAQINNRISFKHFYHSYLSAFFISAGVPNGEFPEILIAKCRSRFYCTSLKCVGDRLLLNANSAVFQSYHGENKISMK
jgi:uncharacterized membrane protein YbhN (UPF0104 family)